METNFKDLETLPVFALPVGVDLQTTSDGSDIETAVSVSPQTLPEDSEYHLDNFELPSRKRKIEEEFHPKAKRARISNQSLTISNSHGKTFNMEDLDQKYKLRSLPEEKVAPLARNLHVPLASLRVLWQAARRQEEDKQLAALLKRNSMDDSDDGTDSPDEGSGNTAKAYVAKVMEKYDFSNAKIPPSPSVEYSKPVNGSEMKSLQLETWTEEERNQNKKMTMQAKIREFFANVNLDTLSDQEMNKIVKENKFDQKLITDFKDYSQESNQKLEEIKSSFDLVKLTEIECEKLAEENEVSFEHLKLIRDDLVKKEQAEINSVSWWEMNEDEMIEMLQEKDWDQELVNEAMSNQRKQYQQILNDARYHARRLAGCSDEELVKLEQELKVPMGIILKEIMRYRKQLVKNVEIANTGKTLFIENAPEDDDDEISEYKDPYVQPAPTKSLVPQAWTPEEEAQLTALVEKYGNDWDRVAANMSRSRGAVSVHWCMMKKRSKEAVVEVQDTQFRGVTKRMISGCYKPFIASIFHKGKWRKIGVFKTARDAARAYDVEALRLLGPEPELNFTYNHETQEMYECLKKRKLLRKSPNNIQLPKLDCPNAMTVHNPKKRRRKSKRLENRSSSDDVNEGITPLTEMGKRAMEYYECVSNTCTFCGQILTSQKIQCKRCKRESYCSTSCFIHNFDNHLPFCWAPPQNLSV